MRRFSIVIICNNRVELMKHSLLSLNMQSFRDFNVVVVDDGSDISLEEELCSLPVNFPVIYHRNESMTGYSNARNDGVFIADGELIIINDSGMISPPHYLSSYDKLYKEYGRNSAISGFTYYLHENYLPEQNNYIEFLAKINTGQIPADECNIRKWYKLIGEPDRWKCFIGTNSSFYREDALLINGYHTKFSGWGPDDIEIAYRLKKVLGRNILMSWDNANYHIWHPSANEKNKMESFLKNNQVLQEIHPEIKWAGILPVRHFRKFLESANIELDTNYIQILDEIELQIQ